MPPDHDPANGLTQAERNRVFSLVATADRDLADRVADLLEPDPVVRAVAELGRTFSAEMRHMERSFAEEARQTRNQMVLIVVLAMGINAAALGISVGFGLPGVGSVSVSPAADGAGAGTP